MNLIDAWVAHVNGEPQFHSWEDGAVTCWTVNVDYHDMGGEGSKDLSFNTKEEALAVKPGYKFQH